jgi:hypothetical protein
MADENEEIDLSAIQRILSSSVRTTDGKPKKTRIPGVCKSVARKLAKLSPRQEPEAKHKWCLMESPEGEPTRVRVFSVLSDLLRYLHQIDDTEVVVSVVYGVACSVTRKNSKGDRYLLLDKETAAHVGDSENPVIVPNENMVTQSDGWLGDAWYPLSDQEDEDDNSN